MLTKHQFRQYFTYGRVEGVRCEVGKKLSRRGLVGEELLILTLDFSVLHLQILTTLLTVWVQFILMLETTLFTSSFLLLDQTNQPSST